MSVVVDASAVLAWLQDEQGADYVDAVIGEASVSAVNHAEVLQKSRQHGLDERAVSRQLTGMGLAIVAVTAEDAAVAARLWRRERPLSLGDRFCIALGMRLDATVATAEHAWADIDGVAIELIR